LSAGISGANLIGNDGAPQYPRLAVSLDFFFLDAPNTNIYIFNLAYILHPAYYAIKKVLQPRIFLTSKITLASS
jgi:hypothetical protein